MMIYPIIFLAVLIASQSESLKVEENLLKDSKKGVARALYDDKLKKFLEQLKEMMKNGNESMGIPPLDPYKSGPLDLSINWEDLRGDLSFKNGVLSGLSNYNVKNANFSIVGFKLNITLEWPKIEGTVTDYILSNGRLMNFINVFGKGDANFFIENVKFSIAVAFSTNATSKYLYIKTVNTTISIADNGDNGDIEFYTEGFYDDRDISQVISGVISEVFPKAFATYYKDLINALNKFILDTGNTFLDGKTLKDLLDIISGVKNVLL